MKIRCKNIFNINAHLKYLKNRTNGITLIALVITIIVLLILAGITIATLTGDNGILTKAEEAKEKTEKAQIKEEIQIAILNSYKQDGKLDTEKLKENLKLINNIDLNSIPDKFETGIQNTIYPFIVDVANYQAQIINEQEINITRKEYEIFETIQIKGYTSDDNKYAYFNTEYIPTKNTGIEIKANRERLTNAYTIMVGSSSQSKEQPMDYMLGISNTHKIIYSFGKGGSWQNFKEFSDVGTIGAKEFVNIYMDKESCKVKKENDDTVYVIDNQSYNENNLELNIKIPILIGGENTSVEEGIGAEKLNYIYSQTTKEFKYVKIYENQKLIKNYIPAQRIKDGEKGMLEIIENKFIEKRGDGKVDVY